MLALGAFFKYNRNDNRRRNEGNCDRAGDMSNVNVFAMPFAKVLPGI
jgi:hypothetical protein